MPKFNMGDVGGGNNTACQLRWVKTEDIEDNALNVSVYQVANIKSLADNILLNGLLQPPLVQDLHNGKYRLISGHRRIAAIKYLVTIGHNEFSRVQCAIDNDTDEVSVHMKLLAANMDNREKTNGERLEEAKSYMEAMEKRKQQEKLPGRVRDLVAKQLNISTGQLSELLALDKNLSPELLQIFKEDKISKTVAVEMSKCSKEVQDEFVWGITSGKEFTVKDVLRYRKALSEEDSAADERGEDVEQSETVVETGTGSEETGLGSSRETNAGSNDMENAAEMENTAEDIPEGEKGISENISSVSGNSDTQRSKSIGMDMQVHKENTEIIQNGETPSRDSLSSQRAGNGSGTQILSSGANTSEHIMRMKVVIAELVSVCEDFQKEQTKCKDCPVFIRGTCLVGIPFTQMFKQSIII